MSEIIEPGDRVLNCQWSQSLTCFWGMQGTLIETSESKGLFVAAHSHTSFTSSSVLTASRTAGVTIRIAHVRSTTDLRTDHVAQDYCKIALSLVHRNTTVPIARRRDASRYVSGHHFGEVAGLANPNSAKLERFGPQDPDVGEKATPLRDNVVLTSLRGSST